METSPLCDVSVGAPWYLVVLGAASLGESKTVPPVYLSSFVVWTGTVAALRLTLSGIPAQPSVSRDKNCFAEWRLFSSLQIK